MRRQGMARPLPFARATPVSEQLEVLFPQLLQTTEFGCSNLWWSMKVTFFGDLRVLGDISCCPATLFQVEIGESPDDEYPPPPCLSYALVQATAGVGTVLIPDLI